MRPHPGFAVGVTLRLLIVLAATLLPLRGIASVDPTPDAAFVMDARTGQVLLSENAEARLHPASLTKMMTLYIAFAALEQGEIALPSRVAVSPRAAATGGSRLHLKAGQEIAIEDLILGVAIRSANDAAVALAEAIAGSEAAFVSRMNDMAASMGLTGTAFRNAHGLTAPGHLSTARDMSVLGRRLLLEFPEHAGIHARLDAVANGHRIVHTNRRFLSGYAGADGIKTGFTRAAGFTLTASAMRGEKHVIVTILGAESSAARAAKAARLMNWAFERIPDGVARVPLAPLTGDAPTPAGAAGLLVRARPLFDHAAQAPSVPAPPGGIALSGLQAIRPSALAPAHGAVDLGAF
ncbi:MAG: D-alanyl-D-alanine carboxypeptidase family protein [Pseudomonadota bacterium]